MSSSCLSLVSSPVPQPAKKWKYIPTLAIDEQIRQAYARQRQGSKQALKSVALRLGWPVWAVTRRGAELGITRAKERPWSAEEEEILQRHGHLTWSGLQRALARAGFDRTCAAISVKTSRLHIKSNLEGYSACRLANALGVDAHKVLAWIRRGLLNAERRETERTPQQGGDSWWITNRDVKRFVMRVPEEIDLARVEKFWFLDLLTDGKICR